MQAHRPRNRNTARNVRSLVHGSHDAAGFDWKYCRDTLRNFPYSEETENWVAQAIAQDLVNLVAFLALAILAILAVRGSLRAYLAWLGVVAYGTYTYAIYAFALHFGPLFLVHVAVFGMSIYTLIVGLMRIDYELVKEVFTEHVPRRFIASLLITIGAFFYLLWLASVIPSLIAGETPEEIVKAGLLTNPVHVLDMAVLLPAMLLAGFLLLRQRAFGYVLAHRSKAPTSRFRWVSSWFSPSRSARRVTEVEGRRRSLQLLPLWSLGL